MRIDMGIIVFAKKVKNKINYIKVCSQNKKKIEKSFPQLKQYKDKFAGKRCFIIGNGPSLRTDDLEKLGNEITFASNGIYFVYDKTDWRPYFYCVQDTKLINERYRAIIENCSDGIKFFGLVKDRKYPLFPKDSIFIELLNEPFVDGLPKFSDNALDGFYEGMTVTYFNIQLAVYMGIKEIYLIGVDHFYSGDENDHFSKDDKCDNPPQTDKSTCAYIKAKEYADKNGVKIFNATRGGRLEVFDRVDFDEIV